jgi:hypothetical protein
MTYEGRKLYKLSRVRCVHLRIYLHWARSHIFRTTTMSVRGDDE